MRSNGGCTYDGLDRLISEQHAGSDDEGVFLENDITYGYDAVGNRNRVVVNGQQTVIPTTGQQRDDYRYAGDPQYERVTHRSPDSQWGLDYDAADRLTRTHVHPTRPDAATTHVYNSDGVLMRSITAGVTTTYTHDLARSLPVLIGRKVGNAEREWYAYLPGSLLRLGQHAPDGTLIAHLHDFQHSLRATLDAQGRTQPYAYTAFGVPLTYAQHPVFGVAGELHDPLSGLVSLRARWYDPDSGTLLTTDPYHGDWQQPYGHHPYQYAYSNPLRFADPSGEEPITLLAMILIRASVYAIGLGVEALADSYNVPFVGDATDLFFGYTTTREGMAAWNDPHCSLPKKGAKAFWGAVAFGSGITAAIPIGAASGGAMKASGAANFGMRQFAEKFSGRFGDDGLDAVVQAVRRGGNGLAEMRRVVGVDVQLARLPTEAKGVLGYHKDGVLYLLDVNNPNVSVTVHELTHAIQQYTRGNRTQMMRRWSMWATEGNGIAAATKTLLLPPSYLLNPIEIEASANAIYYGFNMSRATTVNTLSPTVGGVWMQMEVCMLSDITTGSPVSPFCQ